MPRKTFRRRTQHTKRTHRGRRNRKQLRNRSTVAVGKGFPKKMMMTHKYQASGLYSVPASTLTKVQFSCNGMYDPDITGVGHQPLFFDQMGAIYDQYTVVGAKIRIELTPAVTHAAASLIGLYKDDDTNTATITETSMIGEQPSGYFKQMALNQVKSTVLTSKWSAKKTFGPGALVGNDRYQGTTAANPTEQTYWTLGIQNLNLTNAQIYLASIKVEYIAVWTELKDIPQS